MDTRQSENAHTPLVIDIPFFNLPGEEFSQKTLSDTLTPDCIFLPSRPNLDPADGLQYELSLSRAEMMEYNCLEGNMLQMSDVEITASDLTCFSGLLSDYRVLLDDGPPGSEKLRPMRKWRRGMNMFLTCPYVKGSRLFASAVLLAWWWTQRYLDDLPAFAPVWHEFQGGLAALAAEAEQDVGMARRWRRIAVDRYTQGLNESPAVGRLYHRLAIIQEQPLQQTVYLVKALMCDYPDATARDLLHEISEKELQADRTKGTASDVRIICASYVTKVLDRAYDITRSSPKLDVDDAFPSLLLSIAILVDFGSPDNRLWRYFSTDVSQGIEVAGLEDDPIWDDDDGIDSDDVSSPAEVFNDESVDGEDMDQPADDLHLGEVDYLEHGAEHVLHADETVERIQYAHFLSMIKVYWDSGLVVRSLREVYVLFVWLYGLHMVRPANGAPGLEFTSVWRLVPWSTICDI